MHEQTNPQYNREMVEKHWVHETENLISVHDAYENITFPFTVSYR